MLAYPAGLGDGSSRFVDDLEARGSIRSDFTDAAARLESVVKSGSRAQLTAYLDNLFDSLLSARRSALETDLMMIQLLSALCRAAGAIVDPSTVDELWRASPLAGLSLSYRSFDELRAKMTDFCLQVNDAISQQCRESGKLLCDQALGMIRAQYGDETLSLASISEALHISPNYLSALIRKNTGETFVNLLTAQRLDAAEDFCNAPRSRSWKSPRAAAMRTSTISAIASKSGSTSRRSPCGGRTRRMAHETAAAFPVQPDGAASQRRGRHHRADFHLGVYDAVRERAPLQRSRKLGAVGRTGGGCNIRLHLGCQHPDPPHHRRAAKRGGRPDACGNLQHHGADARRPDQRQLHQLRPAAFLLDLGPHAQAAGRLARPYRRRARPLRPVLYPPHVQNLYADYYPWVVTIARPAALDRYGGEVFVSMDLQFSSIAAYMDAVGIGQHGYSFIIDSDGRLVYHPQQQLIYSGLKTEDTAPLAALGDGVHADQDLIRVIKSLPQGGWRIVGVSYLDELVRQPQQTALQMLLFAVPIALFILLGVALLIARLVSRPILRLVGEMRDFETAAPDFVYTPVSGTREICVLSDSFEHMVGRIQKLVDEVKSEEETLRKTELKALQAQINPHFLYNTLDSIQWMCELGRTQDAVKMVSALARLFRISTSRGEDLIPIRKELEHAECYLIIQKFRYQFFSYRFDVDESLLDCLCSKITLQPILENAILHGFGEFVEDGEITVSVRPDGTGTS